MTSSVPENVLATLKLTLAPKISTTRNVADRCLEVHARTVGFEHELTRFAEGAGDVEIVADDSAAFGSRDGRLKCHPGAGARITGRYVDAGHGQKLLDLNNTSAYWWSVTKRSRRTSRSACFCFLS